MKRVIISTKETHISGTPYSIYETDNLFYIMDMSTGEVYDGPFNSYDTAYRHSPQPQPERKKVKVDWIARFHQYARNARSVHPDGRTEYCSENQFKSMFRSFITYYPECNLTWDTVVRGGDTYYIVKYQD